MSVRVREREETVVKCGENWCAVVPDYLRIWRDAGSTRPTGQPNVENPAINLPWGWCRWQFWPIPIWKIEIAHVGREKEGPRRLGTSHRYRDCHGRNFKGMRGSTAVTMQPLTRTMFDYVWLCKFIALGKTTGHGLAVGMRKAHALRQCWWVGRIGVTGRPTKKAMRIPGHG